MRRKGINLMEISIIVCIFTILFMWAEAMIIGLVWELPSISYAIGAGTLPLAVLTFFLIKKHLHIL